MEEIKATLRKIFVETLRLPADSARVEAGDLIAQLGIDSIAFMEIITRVENEFQIMFEEEEVSPAVVNSFNAFAAYIASKKKGNSLTPL